MRKLLTKMRRKLPLYVTFLLGNEGRRNQTVETGQLFPSFPQNRNEPMDFRPESGSQEPNKSRGRSDFPILTPKSWLEMTSQHV